MLKKAFFSNSSGILCSRIFGFFRDVYMASSLGAGVYSDIFFIAFKLPNLFRRIFGEGAFTQSFLPSFIHARYKGMFALSIGGIFCFCLLFLSLVVFYFSPFFTKLLAFGFPQETIDLAAPIVSINFWYLLLVFIVTFLSTLLQYKNVFWVNAYNTALLNIAMILALTFSQDRDKLEVVYMLSYGVLCGGIAQILLHLYPLYRHGFLRLFWLSMLHCKVFQTTLNKKNKFKSDFKDFFKQFFPALLGSSTAQLIAFIETFIASFLSFGSISYLYYANRIFQLPLALFAIAISTALFPMVAKAIKASQEQKALEAMKKAFWFLCITLCACTLGGIMLSKEIIWLLYQRGSFSAQDTLITSQVFALYLIGLLPFGLSRIFSLWLYSHRLQGRAAKYSLISLICGTFFSFVLIKPLGVLGLALSSSIAGFILLILNAYALGAKNFFCIILHKNAAILLVGILICETALLYGIKLLLEGYIL
ncbi:murein biosynthesis integral membrane protein MurJ [Helicobacter pametensis]|uniref:murein biosynthesis integral membrane protein MurJ n=1 Tax=Helicobacter pametensis TaxID=95149 RepID=UPI000487CC80|nr:murein biosynthesis integral membrane protein MurJ [Helicobacter pametensis]